MAVLRAIDQGEAPNTERQTVGQFLDHRPTDVAKLTVRQRAYHSDAAWSDAIARPHSAITGARDSAPSTSGGR